MAICRSKYALLARPPCICCTYRTPLPKMLNFHPAPATPPKCSTARTPTILSIRLLYAHICQDGRFAAMTFSICVSLWHVAASTEIKRSADRTRFVREYPTSFQQFQGPKVSITHYRLAKYCCVLALTTHGNQEKFDFHTEPSRTRGGLSDLSATGLLRGFA